METKLSYSTALALLCQFSLADDTRDSKVTAEAAVAELRQRLLLFFLFPKAAQAEAASGDDENDKRRPTTCHDSTQQNRRSDSWASVHWVHNTPK